MDLSFGVRLLVIATAMLMAVIVGMLGGILARLEGRLAPSCVMRGAAACGVTLTLLLLILSSLGVLAS